MKKLFTLAFTLGALGALQAQITITDSDFASVGDVVKMGVDTLPVSNLDLGQPGPQRHWYFEDLQTNYLKNINFQDPSSLPNGASFPTSNIAQIENGNTVFLEKTSAGIEVIGTVQMFNGMSFDAQFNPTYTILPFPLNYNDTYGGTYQFSEKIYLGIDTTVNVGVPVQIQLDSVWIKRASTINATVDAWGTIYSPLAHVPALRSSVNQVNVDSTWVYFGQAVNIPLVINIPQGWNLIDQAMASQIAMADPALGAALGNATSTTTVNTKEFFAKNYKYRFASIEVDANNTPIRAEFLSNESVMNALESFESNPALKVYPNPTASFISFTENLMPGTEYRIYDMKGAVIEAKNIQSNTLSVSHLANGNYTIVLYNANQTVLASEKFIVAK